MCIGLPPRDASTHRTFDHGRNMTMTIGLTLAMAVPASATMVCSSAGCQAAQATPKLLGCKANGQGGGRGELAAVQAQQQRRKCGGRGEGGGVRGTHGSMGGPRMGVIIELFDGIGSSCGGSSCFGPEDKDALLQRAMLAA
jgi:hypothetical protein